MDGAAGEEEGEGEVGLLMLLLLLLLLLVWLGGEVPLLGPGGLGEDGVVQGPAVFGGEEGFVQAWWKEGQLLGRRTEAHS